MNATIDQFGNLVVGVSRDEHARLRHEAIEDGFDSDRYMYDLFEPFIANSEYDWCRPEEIGALTDAPILCTHDENGGVEKAWGFMEYQVISAQRQLAEHGQAIFKHGGE